MEELPIIQKTYDLNKWYVPILNRLPKSYKFTLADRIINELYDLLSDLVMALYAQEKLAKLESVNCKLDILRYQTRLLFEFRAIAVHRYEYVGKLIDGIDVDLGGWIKHRTQRQKSKTLSL
jgi:hypothetical protein